MKNDNKTSVLKVLMVVIIISYAAAAAYVFNNCPGF